ncbi:unnamed protein product [Ceutorhynchus assimilis]|uniref:Uncharacterized protein n=1 Tax=Ceutorhynchus assimilis TaxID=467358 RepID=A0A9N9QDI5_9CUCU|nr:unnamed protein product [Ceutorhynchus assimilis]
MRTTTDPEFVQADSYNLPEVTCEMIDIYYEEIADYFIAGVRNVKAQRRATRESFGDVAVGYVQLKRDHPQCIVKLVSRQNIKFENKAIWLVCALMKNAIKGLQAWNSADFLVIEETFTSVSNLSRLLYWKKSSLAKLGDLKPTTTVNIFKYKRPPL